MFGWGVHLQSEVAQGCWTSRDLLHDINWLELRAVHLALHHFQSSVEAHHVLVLMDNVTAKVHINREGGTHSRPLMDEATRMLNWAEKHTLLLMAKHISCMNNIQVDWHPNRSGGVAASSVTVPGFVQKVQSPICRPLCSQEECATSPILHLVSMSRSRRL